MASLHVGSFVRMFVLSVMAVVCVLLLFVSEFDITVIERSCSRVDSPAAVHSGGHQFKSRA